MEKKVLNIWRKNNFDKIGTGKFIYAGDLMSNRSGQTQRENAKGIPIE